MHAKLKQETYNKQINKNEWELKYGWHNTIYLIECVCWLAADDDDDGGRSDGQENCKENVEQFQLKFASKNAERDQ